MYANNCNIFANMRQSSCEISNFTVYTHELRLQRILGFQDFALKTTATLGKPS